MFEPIEKDREQHSVVSFVAGKNDIESPESKEEILDFINSDSVRPKNHAAHQLIFDFANKNKKIVGFKCNCGAGVFHQFDLEGRPLWRENITKKEMILKRKVTKVNEPIEVETYFL